ncbi:MAG TPA: hypothetical protein VGD11_11810 [Mycobacteriales bacterium]
MLAGALALAASSGVLPAGSPAYAATERGCVSRTVSTVYENGGVAFDHVSGKNNCGKTVKVRVMWSLAPDGGCQTLGSGQTYAATAPNAFASDDRLDSC